MPHYKFDEIAFNITDKKMPEPGDQKMYIGLEHLDPGSLKIIRWGSEVELTGQKLVMKKGDVLFGRRNTYLRRAAIAPHDGIFSAHGMIFRPKINVIDSEFFPFFIFSNYFMDSAIRISVGSLSPTVNWKTLKELEFEIPTLDEQRDIAKQLQAINETKELYKELLKHTDKVVKSKFIEMFGDPIINSKKWETLPLMEVAPEYNPEIPKQDTYWWLNLDMIDSYTGSIIEKVYSHIDDIGSSTSTFDNSMVLYSKLRPYLNKVVVPSDFGYCTNELVGFKPDTNKLKREFLFNILRSDSFVSLATKISNGSQMPRMPIKILREFEVVLPPLELQESFIRISEHGDKAKVRLKETIQSCDDLIKSILFNTLEEKEE